MMHTEQAWSYELVTSAHGVGIFATQKTKISMNYCYYLTS